MKFLDRVENYLENLWDGYRLTHGNPEKWQEAARDIRNRTEKGNDISRLVPLLLAFLQKPMKDEREQPARAYALDALIAHYLRTENWDGIEALLSRELTGGLNAKLRRCALFTLQRAIPTIRSLERMGHLLVRLSHDPELYFSASSLVMEILKREHCPRVLYALVKAMVEAPKEIRQQIASQLESAEFLYAKIGEVMPLLTEAMERGYDEVGVTLVYLFQNMAAYKVDISLAVPLLIRSFWLDLGPYGIGLSEAGLAVTCWIRNCPSIEKLDVAARTVEEDFAYWLQKQPQRPTPKRIEMREQVAEVLKRMAGRKAQLGREQDGALLVGETIERPKSGNGIYRTIRRNVR